MKKKGNLSNYLIAVAFIIMGILLALDWLDIDLFGLKGSWFAFLLILVALSLMIGGIVQKSKTHISTPSVCGIIGAMLLLISATELTIGMLWPMIPLSVSVALVLSSLIRDHVRLLIEIGFVGIILSGAFLVGTIFGLWNIVFPVVLVLGGVVIIVRTALTKKEIEYVIPTVSIEERKEKILQQKENEE